MLWHAHARRGMVAIVMVATCMHGGSEVSVGACVCGVALGLGLWGPCSRHNRVYDLCTVVQLYVCAVRESQRGMSAARPPREA